MSTHFRKKAKPGPKKRVRFKLVIDFQEMVVDYQPNSMAGTGNSSSEALVDPPGGFRSAKLAIYAISLQWRTSRHRLVEGLCPASRSRIAAVTR
jgi:hypothetical protein